MLNTIGIDQPSLARRQNWITHLSRHALMQADRTALRFMGATTTWFQLHARVNALADALSRRRVREGDRVLILMLNRPEFIESVLAVNSLGAIAVPVNFRLAPPEISFVAADCDARLIVADSALADAAIACRGLDNNVSRVIATGTELSGVECYEDVLEEPGEPHKVVDMPDDSPALIMYTSGTTGRPKGAVLTHANLAANTLTTIITMGADVAGDVGFVGVPLFHIAGIANTATALTLGIPTVIYPVGAFEPGELLDVVAGERVTSLFLVPAQWQAVCAAQRSAPRKLHLRTLSWGAAPASDALLREIGATFPGAQIRAAFGQTEMSPVTCTLSADDAVRKRGSVGRVVPTVAARVVDEHMNDVPVGQVGEIVYRAPTLMAGYWNNPGATAEVFAGGWFHSGDLVRQDEDGYIWVVDRKKDMIISGGENIYCAEVENALADHPAIIEVAVIGRPHDKWGEVPLAVVASQRAVVLSELEDFLNGRLARYKHPKAVEVVDALPRNAAGKVLKGELRSRFAVQ